MARRTISVSEPMSQSEPSSRVSEPDTSMVVCVAEMAERSVRLTRRTSSEGTRPASRKGCASRSGSPRHRDLEEPAGWIADPGERRSVEVDKPSGAGAPIAHPNRDRVSARCDSYEPPTPVTDAQLG